MVDLPIHVWPGFQKLSYRADSAEVFYFCTDLLKIRIIVLSTYNKFKSVWHHFQPSLSSLTIATPQISTPPTWSPTNFVRNYSFRWLSHTFQLFTDFFPMAILGIGIGRMSTKTPSRRVVVVWGNRFHRVSICVLYSHTIGSPSQSSRHTHTCCASTICVCVYIYIYIYIPQK